MVLRSRDESMHASMDRPMALTKEYGTGRMLYCKDATSVPWFIFADHCAMPGCCQADHVLLLLRTMSKHRIMIQARRTGAVGPLLFHLRDILTNPPVRAFQPSGNGSVPRNRVWSHYLPGCSIVNSRIQDHRARRTIRWHMAKL